MLILYTPVNCLKMNLDNIKDRIGNLIRTILYPLDRTNTISKTINIL